MLIQNQQKYEQEGIKMTSEDITELICEDDEKLVTIQDLYV